MAYIGLAGGDDYTPKKITQTSDLFGGSPFGGKDPYSGKDLYHTTLNESDPEPNPLPQTPVPPVGTPDFPPGTPNPDLPNTDLEHVAGGKPTDGAANLRLNDNYILSNISEWAKMPGANPSLANDPNYWLKRIKETGGLGNDNLAYWRGLGMRPEGAPEGGGGAPPPTFNQPPSAPAVGGNPNVFSDPATQEWEKALRAMVDRLNQPTTKQLPDYQPLVDYMRTYIDQLKQPGHTPEQQDLIQTQALDPMERQRQAAHQQVIQRLAARGIAPSSGVVEKALQDVDRQFEQLRTKTQSDFALNEIDLNRSNKDRALAVGGQLAGLEAGMASGDEQRANQAVSMLFQLPQFANQRLQLALQTLGSGQVNPALFNSMNMFQQQGAANQQQDQNYYANIAALIAQLFGGAK